MTRVNVARNRTNKCDTARFSAISDDPELGSKLQLLTSGVYAWHDFLSPEECMEIISLAGDRLEKSAVAGENEIKVSSHRTSLSYILQDNDVSAVSHKIRQRISAITRLPPEHQEELKVIKYEKGQEYKIHHDCHLPLTNNEENVFLRQGGLRIFSCLIYLNDAFEGGSTTFPVINFSNKPKAGSLLIWNNLDGEDIKAELVHRAEPVISGDKWAMTTWIREAEYQPLD